MTENGENLGVQIGQLKKDIASTSASLKELSNQKEQKYREKFTLDATLNEYITKAKDLKDKKEEVDKKIRNLKVQRENLNKKVKELSIKLGETRAKKSVVLRKQGQLPVGELRKQIKKLQFLIETEALSFEKEKNYMDKIRHLKVELAEIQKQEESFDEFNNIRRELKQTKEQADKLHREVQDSAKQSSEIFIMLSKLSEDISNIKNTRGGLQVILSSLKTQIGSMNYRLASTLKSWSGATHEVAAARSAQQTEEVRKKMAEVEEKLRQKKKLTTKDILILQSEGMVRKQ